MARLTVVYDANVLYSQPLRSFLMYLAIRDFFNARWSDDIHDEWMRSIRKNRPTIPPEKLENVRKLMDAHVRDCLVTGYHDLIDTLELPDPDDRHVLAAAIVAKADYIVTFNLKDFPPETLQRYGVEALHPDKFVMLLMEVSASTVCGAAREHHMSHRNPALSAEDYLLELERQELPHTVAALRAHCFVPNE